MNVFGRNEGLWVSQVLAMAFLAVLFLQSGLDKVIDWKGNRTYFSTYFATKLETSALRHFPTLMLLGAMFLEVTTGVFCATGALSVFLTRDRSFAFLGACLAGVTVLFLFAGQRLAKDYESAAGMVPYFLATVTAILLVGSG